MFLESNPYDIIHCHFAPNGISGVMLRDSGLVAGNLITSFYGYDLSKKLYKSQKCNYQFLFENGDLFLVLSENMRDDLIMMGCALEKILLHHIGINLDLYHQDNKGYIEDKNTRVLSIARLVPKKGIEDGLRAMKMVINYDKNVIYKIIGDGPLKPDLLRLIHHLGIEEFVTLEGWKTRSELIDLLNNSDILLAPSRTSGDGDKEGTPVVIMEVGAMGLLVVSTLHSGIPEVVKNGISGYLVPEGDINGMSDALFRLIKNPEERKKMGEAGRDHISKNYNINLLNDELIAVFNYVSNSK